MSKETEMINLKIQSILKSISRNPSNYIKFFDDSGNEVYKRFNEVHDDVIKILVTFDKKNMCSGDVCVICGRNSYFWLIAEVACICAGITSIALPETYSEEQIIDALDCYEINAILVDDDLAIRFKKFDCLKMILDGSLLTSQSEERIPQSFLGKEYFEIIAFTSGTTSRIKSFRVYEESTEAFLNNIINKFDINNQDTCLICHSLSHYAHLEYALGALCYGYNLVLSSLIGAVIKFEELKPTFFVSVPTTYELIQKKLLNIIESQNPLVRSICRWYLTTKPFKSFMLNRFMGKIICKCLHNTFGKGLKFCIIGTAPSSNDVKRFFLKAGFPLFEAYGLSEVGMISTNSHDNVKIGSVGKVFPGIDIKVKEGEIWAKSIKRRMVKYDNLSEANNSLVFDKDGYFDTGDLGMLDHHGWLYIQGRKKEIIVTSTGKKINPIPIEELLMESEIINQCMVVGNNRPYLIAIVVLKAGTNLEDVGVALANANINLADNEIIQDVVIANEFKISDGLLTRSNKMIRTAIENFYRHEIDAIFQ